MFDHWPRSGVLFLFMEMRSLNNFSDDEHIRECWMIGRHAMSFFRSSRWDHMKISLIIMKFANVWSLKNIRCPFCVHRDEIIEEFLLWWTHTPMFDRWPRSDVRFLFIEMRSLEKFSDHEDLRQCLIIDQHRMCFFSSLRWDHWRISLIIITFAKVLSLTNIRCPFSLEGDEITEEFLLSASHSPMFRHWTICDVLFLFSEIRSLRNFSDDVDIRQSLIVGQHAMSFYFSSRWDHWRWLHGDLSGIEELCFILIFKPMKEWIRSRKHHWCKESDEILSKFLSSRLISR